MAARGESPRGTWAACTPPTGPCGRRTRSRPLAEPSSRARCTPMRTALLEGMTWPRGRGPKPPGRPHRASWPSPRRRNPARLLNTRSPMSGGRRRSSALFPDWYREQGAGPTGRGKTSRLSPVPTPGNAAPARSITTPVGSAAAARFSSGLFPDTGTPSAGRKRPTWPAADEPDRLPPCDAGEAAPPWHRATIGPAMARDRRMG